MHLNDFKGYLMFFRLLLIAAFSVGTSSCEKNDCKKSPTTIQAGLADDEQPRQEDCGVALDHEQPAIETTPPAPQTPPVESSPIIIVLPDSEAPIALPTAGVYTLPQAVTLTTTTQGADIFYTTDGTEPTSASTLYSAPILFSSSLTIKAIAIKSGYNNSPVSSFDYAIGLALPDPTFSPPAGSYGPAQSVTLSSPYAPDAIYYTTDGSTPTTSSPVYTGPIAVSTTKTIKAFATKAGWADSGVASAAYVINGAVSAPAFSIAGGSYGPAQTVSLSSSTAGALIYYTLNNSTPTQSATQYTGPIYVSTNQTIKAIAIKQDFIDSVISTASYVINGAVASPTFSVAPGSYGPQQTVALSTSTAGASIYYTTNGATPTTSSTPYTGPISVSSTQTIKAFAVKQYFTDSAVATAAYTINGAAAAPTFGVAAGAYGPAQSVTLTSTTTGATIYYTKDGSTPTTSSLLYSTAINVNVSMTIKAIAVKTSFINSSESSATYVINGTVATPTFSPGMGSNNGAYASAQSVTISTTTPGATIYYTTDNSTPSASSTVYSSPVTVSSILTLKAIAMKTNFTTSALQWQAYYITTYGVISTYAGTTAAGSSGDGGLATSATIEGPSGVAVDASGNLYIADTKNNKIRKVNAGDKKISTFAGTGLPDYSGDGSTATSASLLNPYGIVFSPSGDLYFSDQYNNRVRKISMTDFTISTVAGDGNGTSAGDGSPATSASIKFPAGLAFNASGDLFIAEPFGHRVRKVATNGTISTVAGTGSIGSSGDGGQASNAKLSSPTGVAVGTNNKLYIADTGNHKIRVVDLTTGVITTFAGTGSAGTPVEGAIATSTNLNAPRDVKLDSSGNVLIVDYASHAIRMVRSGVITSVVGSGSGGYSGNGSYSVYAWLKYPLGIGLDSSNNLYIADSYNNVIRYAPRVP